MKKIDIVEAYWQVLNFIPFTFKRVLKDQTMKINLAYVNVNCVDSGGHIEVVRCIER